MTISARRFDRPAQAATSERAGGFFLAGSGRGLGAAGDPSLNIGSAEPELAGNAVLARAGALEAHVVNGPPVGLAVVADKAEVNGQAIHVEKLRAVVHTSCLLTPSVHFHPPWSEARSGPQVKCRSVLLQMRDVTTRDGRPALNGETGPAL